MLETVIVVLLILWLLGAFVVPIPAAGSLIHILLFLAVVVLIVRIIQGRRIL